MRYRYYVVYSHFKNNGNGVGALTHERDDKLNNIGEIIGLQASVLGDAQKIAPSVDKIVITNFMLIDEFEGGE